MDRSKLLALVVGLLALSTLGVAATTLETTVTTDPDDEIDPAWEQLPLSRETAAEIQAEMTAAGGGTDGSAADSGGDGDGADSSSARTASGGDSNAAGGAGTAVPNGSLLDRLLALLGTLLQVILGVTVVGGVGGLAYRYRGRYHSLFGVDRAGSPTDVPEPAAWPRTEPTTVVDRAWVRLLTELAPEQPETITPAECVRLARRADLDMTAVEAITTAFERVHYGGHSPAAEQARARDGLDRLTGGDE